MRTLAAVVVLVAATSAVTRAQEWPQFRGPTGQGTSSERGLPLDWSESSHIAWKVPVPGTGWSSPVVAAGRVWVTTATGDRDISLRLLAFDVSTGGVAVNTEVFRVSASGVGAINPKNNHASPTPIVEGDRVYVHFGAQGTAALSTSGVILWKKQFGYTSQHGAGGSPVIYDDLLIFNCDGGEDAFVIALEKMTGKTKWRMQRRQPWDQAYTTPLVIRVGARDELVSVGAFRAQAIDPVNGREIWRVGFGDGFSNVPRPVYGHGLVFIATGFQQASLLAVRVDGSGDVTRTHVAWSTNRAAPYTPSPLLVGNELFVVSDIGIATCYDAITGVVRWQQRLPGNYSASPVSADGRIYVLNEEGLTTVLAEGAVFKRLSTNTLDGSTLASMAVADGAFYIRSLSHLYKIRP